MIEIKTPTTVQKPDFVTGKKSQTYKFACDVCNSSIAIDFDSQINNSWTGRTEKINEEETRELNNTKVNLNDAYIGVSGNPKTNTANRQSWGF